MIAIKKINIKKSLKTLIKTMIQKKMMPHFSLSPYIFKHALIHFMHNTQIKA